MSDESWRQLDNKAEAVAGRIAWARVHMTEFTRPTDAARSLNIPPGTYRTYEVPKADGGRVPPLVTIQKIAAKFKVSWAWMATGDGSPYDKDEPTPLMVVTNDIAKDLEDVPAEKLDDAVRAARAVLSSFKRTG